MEERANIHHGEEEEGAADQGCEEEVAPAARVTHAPEVANVAAERGNRERAKDEGNPGRDGGGCPNPGQNEREHHVLNGATDRGEKEPIVEGTLGALWQRGWNDTQSRVCGGDLFRCHRSSLLLALSVYRILLNLGLGKIADALRLHIAYCVFR
jgi:hypothetical protein